MNLWHETLFSTPMNFSGREKAINIVYFYCLSGIETQGVLIGKLNECESFSILN